MCNVGKITVAREFFNTLPTKGLQPSVRTYNIMIKGLYKEGLLNEARKLLSILYILMSLHMFQQYNKPLMILHS
jgi:hypothetical protein